MNIKRRYTFLVFVILFFTVTYSQEYAHFDHYTAKDGLSSNKIFDIKQDSTGFLWIATDFGLNRFDGTQFKRWKKDEYPSMFRNDIFCLQPTETGLLIGSYDGLLIEYDFKKDEFIDRKPADFDLTYYRETKGFYFPKEGECYAYTIGGIYRFDKKSHEFLTDFPAFRSINKYVKSMFVDQYGRYWIGSYDRLLIFSARGKLIKQYDSSFSPCGYITSIVPNKDNTKLIVSSITNQLWVFDISGKKINDPEIIRVPFENIFKILRDSKNRYWFATDGFGLWYTDEEIGSNTKFTSIKPYGINKDEIQKIYSIEEDHDGNIWIGTQNTGLWRYKRNQLHGIVFSSNFGFPSAVCSGFIEDSKGNIIVSTDGKGLYNISPDFKNIKSIDVPNNNVLSMEKVKGEGIWLSTWGGGILKYFPESNKIEQETFNGIESPNKCIFSSMTMPDGEIFCCTAGGGLYIRNKQKQWYRKTLKAENYPVEDIWTLRSAFATNNIKWVITTNTFWRFENGVCKPILPNVTDLKSRFPLNLREAVCDEDGNILAATNQGVMFFKADGSRYETLKFLPNGEYKAILRYKDGTFWTTGSNGILSFDLKKQTYKRMPGNYTDMTKCDFYNHSIYTDSKGKIYAGTNGGFFMFDPQVALTDSTISYFSFSDLYISNKKIKPFENEILKEGSLSDIEAITLTHNQSSYVTIQMDIIDFSEYNKAICEYKLQGLDKDWIKMDENRSITFSYLPAGEYTLDVVAYKENLPKLKVLRSLKIIVLPPWWASWWFKSLVIIAFILGIGLYILNRVRRLERQKAILQVKVEERTSELKQALCDKDRLISVIAHDLKNPMFAIVGALETWKSKDHEMDSEKRSSFVGDILRSAQTLQNEMIKLLDWARSKKDDIVCHPTNTDVKFIINKTMILLNGMILDKHLHVNRDINLKNFAYIDSRMLDTVIRNLISNAIKFTKEGGNIDIKAWQEENVMKLSITDSGIGMSQEQINDIFNGKCNSTLGTQNEKGTGLGFSICQDYMVRNKGKIEIESEVGKGSSITLTFPMSDKPLEEESEMKSASTNFILNKELLEGNTILVVDDDPLICANLKNMLESYANVITANNGKVALELAEKHIPDVILSDVDMPEMNGIEMSKELGKSDKTKHIPILFISAKNEDSDRIMGLLSGAIDYISKPFSQTELLIKLSNILGMRQKQQQKLLNEMLQKGKTDENPAAEQPEMNPFLKDLLVVLDEQYTNSQLSIEDMANHMCVSQSTLNRKVRSITGKTPLDVLNEYRMNKALQLLKSTQSNVSVGDIAYMVGFNDPAYFTKKFREFYGYTPSKA
ncbi:MAG: response regulator [Paludibacteraceae bacterium]|nr:response regulator [Paludibacteraceae bacterium]